MAILHDYLVHTCGAENVFPHEPLAKHTTMRVGGPADFLVQVPQKSVLVRLLSALEFLGEPYLILGMGANTVFADAGFRGVVIKPQFKEIYHNDQFIYADAGARLGVVGNYAREHGLSGLEWSTGIPATMGGAVFMNCGAYGGQMADVVAMVDVWEHGSVKTLSASALDFDYRHSVFHTQPMVILGVYLNLKHGDPVEIGARMREIAAKRQSHPHEPSAGSVFKRPYDGFYVGAAIEQAGLKGKQIGGAQVSPAHANFIINTGSATAHDVTALIEQIQDAVRQQTGVDLEPEIRFHGAFD